MARTYCLFVEQEEVYRSCFTDCLAYLDEQLNGENTPEITLLIMLPQELRLKDLAKDERERMLSKLTLDERKEFISSHPPPSALHNQDLPSE